MARIRTLPLVGLVAKFLGGIANPNHSNPEEDIEQLEYSLSMLGDVDQPYIALRILIQLVRLKKNSGIDAQGEIFRINTILNGCEMLAYPTNIQEAFQVYKNKVETMISG
jgi:hypothetical protein